jgi:plastocyanin
LDTFRTRPHRDERAELSDGRGGDAPRPPVSVSTLTRRDLLRHATLGVAGLGLVGLLAGCGSDAADDDTTPATGVTDVAVRDNVFEPPVIEVPVDTTVTWRWEGDNPHNVVGDGFESEIQTAGTFTHAFAAPGRYDYRCTLHGGMRGEIVVTEALS